MTPLQQQRIIGIILLLMIIGSMALFLLNKVADNHPVEDTSEPVIFDSVVEPLAEQQQEVIEAVEEVQVIIAEPEKPSPAPFIESPIPTQNLQSAASVELPKKVELAPIKPSSAPADDVPQWYIQVGSFSVKNNAEQVAQRLESQGLNPLIKTSQNNGKTIYRVQLPPSKDKASLTKTADQLARTLNLTPRILRL